MSLPRFVLRYSRKHGHWVEYQKFGLFVLGIDSMTMSRHPHHSRLLARLVQESQLDQRHPVALLGQCRPVARLVQHYPARLDRLEYLEARLGRGRLVRLWDQLDPPHLAHPWGHSRPAILARLVFLARLADQLDQLSLGHLGFLLDQLGQLHLAFLWGQRCLAHLLDQLAPPNPVYLSGLLTLEYPALLGYPAHPVALWGRGRPVRLSARLGQRPWNPRQLRQLRQLDLCCLACPAALLGLGRPEHLVHLVHLAGQLDLCCRGFLGFLSGQ